MTIKTVRVIMLKEMEAGRSAADIGRQYEVSKQTIYSWKAKYGSLNVSQAQETRAYSGGL